MPTLPFWVISQIDIENPTDPINLQISRGGCVLAPGNFQVPRLVSSSIVWAWPRVYLRVSSHVFVELSSIVVLVGSDILGIFGSGSGIFGSGSGIFG